jgi:hypothetical protein
MSIYGCNMNLELQQRAVEYNLVIRKYENLRDGLFEQMPPLELRPNINLPNGMDDDENGEQQEDGNEQSLLGEMNGASENNDASTNEALVKQKQKEEATKTLLDLFDDDLGGISTTTTTTTTATTTNNNNKINNDLFDLMSTNDNDNSTTASINSKIDAIKQLSNKQSQPPASSNNLDSIFNLGPSGAVKSIAPTICGDQFDLLGGSNHLDNNKTTANINNGNSGLDDLFGGLGVNTNNSLKPKPTNDIMDLFNTGSTISNNNNNGFDSLSSSNSSMVVYEKNDIKIILEPTAGGKHSTDEQHFIQMTAQNNGLMSMVKEFLFSAAVPKTMQMQLSTPSTSVIQPMDSLVQTMAISNPKKVFIFSLILLCQ